MRLHGSSRAGRLLVLLAAPTVNQGTNNADPHRAETRHVLRPLITVRWTLGGSRNERQAYVVYAEADAEADADSVVSCRKNNMRTRDARYRKDLLCEVLPGRIGQWLAAPSCGCTMHFALVGYIITWTSAYYQPRNWVTFVRPSSCKERHPGRDLGMDIRPLEDLCGEIRYAVMSHPTVLRSLAMSVLKREKRMI